MISNDIYLKKGKIVLCGWTWQYGGWYSRIDLVHGEDVIRLEKYPNGPLGENTWRLSFEGKRLKYLSDLYRTMYGYEKFYFLESDLGKMKQEVDHFLRRIDKLMVFL